MGEFLSWAECEEFCGTLAELFFYLALFKSRAEYAELAEGVLWNSRGGIIWRGEEGAEGILWNSRGGIIWRGEEGAEEVGGTLAEG